MLFPEEDAPLLKKWIVKRLENTSDADADVLADYVLALLRHEGSVSTVRELCEHEIPDFLKEDSTNFVNDVFQAIHYKSYLPGAPAAQPRRLSPNFAPPSGPSAASHGNIGVPIGPANGSRKRSFQDRGDWDSPDRGFQHPGESNGRSYKQIRRGGISIGRGNFDTARGGGYTYGTPQPELPGLVDVAPRVNELAWNQTDPAGQLAVLGQLMGFPVSVSASFPRGGASMARGFPGPSVIPPKKQRCRDYDIKGFCARGNTCMFEHGENSIWVPPQQQVDEYDPSTSLMAGIESNGSGSIPNIQLRGSYRGRGRGIQDRSENRQFSSNTRRPGRSEFSSDRPNYDDKSNTTIVVENIPEEAFFEEQVRAFFSEFGTILDVSMRPYKRLAIVKYEDWNSALAAYKSPKVIFDNRFVKVYWYLDQDSLPKSPTLTTTETKSGGGLRAPLSSRPTSEPQIDFEEFARKQDEAQKIHEEKLKKKHEVETAKKDLERRQEDLLKNQAEEKKRLMEKIAAKTGKSTLPVGESQNGNPMHTYEKPTAQTEALKAQLAALEAEAQSLGIDTSLSDEASSWGGRGRGRGRGGFRARGGSFIPRGYRGGFRGRGSAAFAAGPVRSFNLDNRTKRVGMSGVDFSNMEKDESLRQYLLGIGEYTDIEVTQAQTIITFKDRFTAEKFMYGTPGGEIPSVGKVELAWVQTPLPPATVTAIDQPVVKDSVDEETTMAEGDVMAASISSPAKYISSSQQEQHAQRQDENLDYDVADDNDY